MVKRKSTVPASTITERLLEGLKQAGPMTTTELAYYLGHTRGTLATHIRLLRKGAEDPLRITGWVFPEGRGLASARYGLKKGSPDKTDAPKPKQTIAEQKRKRYHKDKLRVSLQRNGERSKSFRVNNLFGVYLGKKDVEAGDAGDVEGNRADDNQGAGVALGLDPKQRSAIDQERKEESSNLHSRLGEAHEGQGS